MNNNIILNDSLNGYEIVIRSGNIGLLAVFLSVWAAGWTYGGYEAWKAIINLVINFDKEPGNVIGIFFIGIWLIGWVAGEAIAILILLWGFLGKEIITVSQGVMKIKNDIAGMGWARVFNINAINGMQINVVIGKKLFEVKADFRAGKKKFGGIGQINFKYEGKINRFCMSADKKDSEQVLELLKKILPREVFENKEKI